MGETAASEREPIFAEDGITLYGGDMLDILPGLGTFFAVVTDPPYGIEDAPRTYDTSGKGNRQGKKKGAVNTWHPPSEWDRKLCPEWFATMAAASPLVAAFGFWRKREEVAAMVGLELRAEIVWAKDCHTGPPAPLALADERVWLFSKAAIKPQRFEPTVWHEPIIPTWEHRFHRNEKPLRLMKRLLRFLCPLNQPDLVIVDPFAGSGSTLVAARDLGLQAVGIEKSREHCATIVDRLRQRRLNLSFTGEP